MITLTKPEIKQSNKLNMLESGPSHSDEIIVLEPRLKLFVTYTAKSDRKTSKLPQNGVLVFMS